MRSANFLAMAVADDGEERARLREVRRPRPQLGHLLEAVGSAIMADQDQHRRPVAPQLAQAHIAPFTVLDDDLRGLHAPSDVRGGPTIQISL